MDTRRNWTKKKKEKRKRIRSRCVEICHYINRLHITIIFLTLVLTMVLKSLFFFYYSLLKQSMTKKDTAIMWTIHAGMEDLFHPNSIFSYSSINDGSVEMKLIGKWLKVNEGIVFCFVDKLPTDSTGKRSRLQRYYGRKKMFASFNDWSERNVLLSGWKNFLNGKRKKEKEIEKEKKKTEEKDATRGAITRQRDSNADQPGDTVVHLSTRKRD